MTFEPFINIGFYNWDGWELLPTLRLNYHPKDKSDDDDISGLWLTFKYLKFTATLALNWY